MDINTEWQFRPRLRTGQRGASAEVLARVLVCGRQHSVSARAVGHRWADNDRRARFAGGPLMPAVGTIWSIGRAPSVLLTQPEPPSGAGNSFWNCAPRLYALYISDGVLHPGMHTLFCRTTSCAGNTAAGDAFAIIRKGAILTSETGVSLAQKMQVGPCLGTIYTCINLCCS